MVLPAETGADLPAAEIAVNELPVAELPDDPEVLLSALAALEQPAVGVSLLVYVLSAACALLLVLLVTRLWRWSVKRTRYRLALSWTESAESALAELRGRLQSPLANQYPETESVLEPVLELDIATRRDILAEASVLARRVALVAEPRAAIAPLSGYAWLAELDRLAGDTNLFTSGQGRLLAAGPYQVSPQCSSADLGDLLSALELLIRGVANRQRASLVSSS